MIKSVFLVIIRMYQRVFSFDHGFMGKIFPNTRYCKFTPTCSEYGHEAIDKYGIIKGVVLLIKRVVKCNPWSEPGKYDPVP